jgi:translation initiation factor IF-3
MAPEVRVIGPDGEQMGVMSMQDAMRRAADFDVDVVETVA